MLGLLSQLLGIRGAESVRTKPDNTQYIEYTDFNCGARSRDILDDNVEDEPVFGVRRELAWEKQGNIREGQDNQSNNSETKRKEVCDDCVGKMTLVSCSVSYRVDIDNGDTTATSLMTKWTTPCASLTVISSSPRATLLTPTMPYLSIEDTHNSTPGSC